MSWPPATKMIAAAGTFMAMFIPAGATNEYDALSAPRTASAAATSGTTRKIAGTIDAAR